MQRFRGELVFKAHRLCVSLNARLESNKEEEMILVLSVLGQVLFSSSLLLSNLELSDTKVYEP